MAKYADASAQRRARRRRAVSVEDAAGRGIEERGGDGKQGGLAGPVRTEQGYDFAGARGGARNGAKRP